MDMSSQKILFQTHFCRFSVALKGAASLQTATHPKGPIQLSSIQLLRTKPFRRLIVENDVLHRAIRAFASTKGGPHVAWIKLLVKRPENMVSRHQVLTA